MEKYSENIDELIASFLNGEASSDEVQKLSQWRTLSAENEKYFLQLAKLFNSSNSTEIPEVNVDMAWNIVQGKMQNSKIQTEKIRKLKPSNSLPVLMFRLAASLVLAAGLFWWLFLKEPEFQTIALSSKNEIINDTLPDGSTIVINKNSDITYSTSYGKNGRHLQLNGEAYFKVKHDDQQPFIIETKGLFIKDVGTAFNVTSFTDSDYVEVIVAEGEVLFYKVNEEPIHVFKGEKAVYHKSTGVMEKMKSNNPNITAYVTGNIDFNNTTLAEVVETLNRIYNSSISFDSRIGDCRLTANFHKENLETILMIIGETLNVQIIQEKSGIKIKGVTCIQ